MEIAGENKNSKLKTSSAVQSEKVRLLGTLNIVMLLACIITMSLLVFTCIFQNLDINNNSYYLYKIVLQFLINNKIIFVCLTVLFFLSAIMIFIKDQFYYISPNWKLRAELKSALSAFGIIPKERYLFSNNFFIYPIKYNRRNKMKIIHFNITSVKINDDVINKLQTSNIFTKAQSVEIKPYINKRDRQNGWLMYVFFNNDKRTFDSLFRSINGKNNSNI